QRQPNNSVVVSFFTDGTRARCDGFEVELRFQGESINQGRQAGILRFQTRLSSQPKVEGRSASRHQPYLQWAHFVSFPTSTRFSCGRLIGGWELRQPLYAVKEHGYTHDSDRGSWRGYLIFEGEPGVVTFSSQETHCRLARRFAEGAGKCPSNTGERYRV